MGVCCIVFDIDGMLFEFCMNFLNIEKNKILRIFFSKFHVFFTFHAISNIKKKKNWLNGRWFLQIVDIGHFIMRLEILKSAPSLTG